MEEDIEEEKGHWEITITPVKVPQNKIIKWLFWEVYWRVWKVWRLNLLAWVFGKLADLFKSKK